MGKNPEAVAGKCSRCGETDESKFAPRNYAKVGGWCRACYLAYNRAWREKQTGKAVKPRVRGTPGVCGNCGETDPAAFTPSARKKAGRWCNACMAAYKRERVPTGRKRSREYQTAWRAKRMVWLREKKKSGCVKCGEKDPACLDFHHMDEQSKTFNIGSKVHIVSLAKLEEEIAKTVVICSNCHRKMHYYGRTGGYAPREGRGHRRFADAVDSTE